MARNLAAEPAPMAARVGAASSMALVAVLALQAVAPLAAAAPATWTQQAFPAMTAPGCVKGDWLGDALYVVRTPLCSLATGQDVTFERYRPADGTTAVLAHLGPDAVQGGAKAIGGKVYLFTPSHPSIPAVNDQVYDPATESLSGLPSRFPGCDVDAPSFVKGSTITFVSNCVWSCAFIVYDAATSTWTALPTSLPGAPGELAKLGLVFDGTVAHILTYSYTALEYRFYDYDAGSGTLSTGPVAAIPEVAGDLVQTGRTTGILGVWMARGVTRIASIDVDTGSWTVEAGALSVAPAYWGLGVAWAYTIPTGGVTCVVPAPTCVLAAAPPPTPDPTPPGSGGGSALTPTPAPPPKPVGDSDGDGVADDADDCPQTVNVDQADLDHDGRGDICHTDRDGDGVPDDAAGTDNCPTVANADQADANGDGRGDACQAGAPKPAGAPSNARDSDGDGVADAQDVCPAIPDAAQRDADHDGQGDLCDADRDGDGIAQASLLQGAILDNCPDQANPEQADANGDGRGDACSDASGPAATVVPARSAADAAPRSAGNAPEAGGLGAAAAVAVTAASAGAVGLGAWFGRRRLALLVAPLFAREAGDPTEHPARRRLMEAVEAQPGVHFNELARMAGQGRGAVRHHLQVLQRGGLVRVVRTGKYTCVYLAQVPAAPGAGVVQSDVARRLESMVRGNPGMTAAEASRTLGVTYGATAYHLRRMADAGLVRLEAKPLAAYPRDAPSAVAGPAGQGAAEAARGDLAAARGVPAR